jgi:hypothetical protein
LEKSPANKTGVGENMAIQKKSGLPGGSTAMKIEKGGGIQTLPKSSNAELGIDGAFVHGTAASLDNNRPVWNKKTSKEMNSGASVRLSDRSIYGGDKYAEAQGGVGARDSMRGPAASTVSAPKGDFSRSAHPNSLGKSSSTSTTGLSGDRIVGTGFKFDGKGGTPGQTGSMGMAMRGLNSGAVPPTNKKPGSPPDMMMSRKGLTKGAGSAKNQ